MKQCLFCKKNTDQSISVEHIIPESLGNMDHVLPKGIVCDDCNNYFATKIEKPLLEHPYFRNLRYRNLIRTKKGRLVTDKALIIHPEGGWVDMWIDEKGLIFRHEDSDKTSLIANGQCKSLIIPTAPDPEPNNQFISKFLAKAALESLAYYRLNVSGWIDELIIAKELDPLRDYARFGRGCKLWKYNQRRIYNEEDRFTDPINHPEPYEILHELDFLNLDGELYYVLVIMGIEYVINMGGNEIANFQEWLIENDNVSTIRRYSEYMINQKKQ